MNDITIIGSGMAACQLVKEIRKLNSELSLKIISPHNCDNYAKPQLSTLSRTKRKAQEIVSMSHDEFCQTYQVEYQQGTIESIQPDKKRIFFKESQNSESYSTLVLAHGAQPVRESELSCHLFFLEDTQKFHEKIDPKSSIAVLGGGLIGCEILDDLSHQYPGSQLSLFCSESRLLKSYLPEEVSRKLEKIFLDKGISLYFNEKITQNKKIQEKLYLNENPEGFDVVVSAIGTHIDFLGLSVPKEKGFLTDKTLQVVPGVYALGDCVQPQGIYRPYIQPLLEQAGVLAKRLTGTEGLQTVAKKVFPVNIKTPSLPLCLIGYLDPQLGEVTYKKHSDHSYLAYQKGQLRQIVLYTMEGLAEKMKILLEFEQELVKNIFDFS